MCVKNFSFQHRIELFESHIRNLEDIAAKNEHDDKKHKHYNSLMVRESFAALLKELWKNGSINYATKWSEFRDKFLYSAPNKPGELLSRFLDPSYVGSYLVDLFEAFIESNTKGEFDEWKQNIPDGLGCSSYQQFEEQVKALPNYSQLESKIYFLPIAYEERLEDIELKKKKEKFRELLQDSVSPSERHWSDVKRRISGRSAYRALDEDDAMFVWKDWSYDERKKRDSAAKKRSRSRSSERRAKHKSSKRDQDSSSEEGAVK